MAILTKRNLTTAAATAAVAGIIGISAAALLKPAPTSTVSVYAPLDDMRHRRMPTIEGNAENPSQVPFENPAAAEPVRSDAEQKRYNMQQMQYE